MSQDLTMVTLTQQQDFQFRVEFEGNVPALIADEPPPMGAGVGPSPVELLSSAVGNCLCNSLLFALRKFKQAPEPLRAQVSSELGRNAEGRMRVVKMSASLHLGVAASELQHLDRVLSQFEDFCTVTRSVGQGIPIEVKVFDATGAQLK